MGQIRSFAPQDVKIILLGNKTDLVEERTISFEEGRVMAEKYDIPFFEASAKTGFNIYEVFHNMGILVLDKVSKNTGTIGENTNPNLSSQNVNNVVGRRKPKCCN